MPTTTISVKDGVLISVKKQTPREYATFIALSLTVGAWGLIEAQQLPSRQRWWYTAGAVIRIAGSLVGAGVVIGKFIEAQDATK